MLAGFVGMALAFGFPVGTYDLDVHESIANADQMAIRAMLHASAGFVAVCGAVLAAAGTILEASLQPSRDPLPGLATPPPIEPAS
jgi:hypothetical protein